MFTGHTVWLCRAVYVVHFRLRVANENPNDAKFEWVIEPFYTILGYVSPMLAIMTISSTFNSISGVNRKVEPENESESERIHGN